MPIECFVNTELQPYSKDDIRDRVCNDLPVIYNYDGEYYCVLHFPNTDKHLTTDFKSVIEERLTNQQNDFGYVYFSNKQNFKGHNFIEYPSFLYSVFAEEAIFEEVEFTSGADFRYTIFKKKADFSLAKFRQLGTFYKANFEDDITFRNAEFEEDAVFKQTKFQSYSYFNRVNFHRQTEFNFAEFNFRVTFYDTKFHYTDFSEAKFFADSSFSNAIFFTEVFFDYTEFKLKAEFTNTVFEEVAFSTTRFEDVCEFEKTKFNKYAFFRRTKFKKALFWRSFFEEHSEILFENVEFESMEFSYCKFKNFITFEDKNKISQTGKKQIKFNEPFIKSPELFTFQTTTLSPSWFINIDVRKLVFTDIKWQNLNEQSTLQIVNTELKCLENIENSKELFKIACRQLAEKAENNNRFEEASKFRQMGFECEKLERKEKISKWFQEPINCSSLLGKIGEKAKSFPYDFVHWLYRWTSGYGENRLWAFFILFLIVTISAIFYSTSLCEFSNGQNGVRSLDLIESIAYSLRVMVLQRPEPFPINNFGKIILALESVIAPLQLALLALAIRRKFMR